MQMQLAFTLTIRHKCEEYQLVQDAKTKLYLPSSIFVLKCVTSSEEVLLVPLPSTWGMNDWYKTKAI